MAAFPQEPPLVVTPPPPVPDEIPDEEDIPDEDDDPDVVPPLPEDDDEPSTDRCGSTAVRCANLAPMTIPAAAASSPTRQVSFLTRRSPSSLAASAFE
jgi:hypothetical protein